MKSAFSFILVLAIAFEAIFTACADNSTCLRESDCQDGYTCQVGKCLYAPPASDGEGGVDASFDAGPDADANAVADADANVDAGTPDADTDASDEDGATLESGADESDASTD